MTHLTATREPQFGATENASISEKEKKEASLQRLTSRLANVIHCNSPDNANILQKVKILKNHAFVYVILSCPCFPLGHFHNFDIASAGLRFDVDLLSTKVSKRWTYSETATVTFRYLLLTKTRCKCNLCLMCFLIRTILRWIKWNSEWLPFDHWGAYSIPWCKKSLRFSTPLPSYSYRRRSNTYHFWRRVFFHGGWYIRRTLWGTIWYT